MRTLIILALAVTLFGEEVKAPATLPLDSDLATALSINRQQMNTIAAKIEIIRLTQCLRAGVTEAQCGEFAESGKPEIALRAKK